MPRVLLIGRGPLPAAGQRQTGFAQLRTAHFRRVLTALGHTVHTLLIERDDDPSLVRRGRELARGADLVVSAGPHRPALVALAVAGDRPLWVDLPGDPLGELDALLRAPGPPIPPERVVAVHGLVSRVLRRADGISVISGPQRSGTLAQLALVGRSVPVAEVPIDHHFAHPMRPVSRPAARGPVVVALSGAFAPWLDDEAIARALELACTEEPRLRLVVTGGAVAGHYTAGWERFCAWAGASAHRHRVHLAGWVPHSEMEALLATAHCGLIVDRDGLEPHFGSRTRALLFAWMGMHTLATGQPELIRHLAAAGLATVIPSDPRGVADALVHFARHPPPPPRRAAWLDSLAAAPLDPAWVQFLDRPQRVPAQADPQTLLARELEDARARLAAVHQSPTWRVLSAVHRAARSLAGRRS